MIPMTCSCGRELKVKPEFAGKKVRCPDCQSVLRVPTTEAPAPDEPEGPTLSDRAADITRQAASKASSAILGLGSSAAAYFSKPATPSVPAIDPRKPPVKLPVEVTSSDTPITLWQRFTIQKQRPEVVIKVIERVSQILTEREELVYIAVQQRLILNWFPDCIVLTSQRMILYQPKILGRVDFTDYIWRHIHNTKLQENIFGATLSFLAGDGTLVSLDCIPKEQARMLYRHAQAAEEATAEERRLRRMEEDRAKAGGVQIMQQIGTGGPQPNDPVQKLQQIKQLLEAGMLTQAEYDQKRAAIIAQL